MRSNNHPRIRGTQLSSFLVARLFAALTAGVILFQVTLAAGMPWGELAWGGSFPGALPAHMRAASVASAFLLLALGMVVLVRAGLFMPDWQPVSRKLVWVVVAYCALGVVANALSPSAWERIVWLPVTILLLVSSIVVAKGP